MTMKEVARWEYETLQSDMAFQGEDFAYKGGFEAWYTEVFKQDEAWEEIRDGLKEDK